jgi:hypothetical protein
MASIRFGAGIVDARGSISGQTFSRNGNGSYIRARTAPVQPNTPAQTAARSAFGARSQAFAGLTQAQALGWEVAAQGELGAYTNRLGQPSQYTAPQLYNSVNGIRQAFGLAIADDVPTLASIPNAAFVDIAAEYSVGTDEYTLTGSAATQGAVPVDFLLDVGLSESTGARATSTPEYRRATAQLAEPSATLRDRLAEAVDNYIPTPNRGSTSVIFLKFTACVSDKGQAKAPQFLVVPVTEVA